MKVFRTRKYIESCIRNGNIDFIVEQILNANWCKILEGKTEEEITQTGYGYTDDWMVEE